MEQPHQQQNDDDSHESKRDHPLPADLTTVQPDSEHDNEDNDDANDDVELGLVAKDDNNDKELVVVNVAAKLLQLQQQDEKEKEKEKKEKKRNHHRHNPTSNDQVKRGNPDNDSDATAAVVVGTATTTKDLKFIKKRQEKPSPTTTRTGQNTTTTTNNRSPQILRYALDESMVVDHHRRRRCDSDSDSDSSSDSNSDDEWDPEEQTTPTTATEDVTSSLQPLPAGDDDENDDNVDVTLPGAYSGVPGGALRRITPRRMSLLGRLMSAAVDWTSSSRRNSQETTTTTSTSNNNKDCDDDCSVKHGGRRTMILAMDSTSRTFTNFFMDDSSLGNSMFGADSRGLVVANRISIASTAAATSSTRPSSGTNSARRIRALMSGHFSSGRNNNVLLPRARSVDLSASQQRAQERAQKTQQIKSIIVITTLVMIVIAILIGIVVVIFFRS